MKAEQVHTIYRKQYPFAVRLPALIISYVFHPLFIPLYVTWFIAFMHPRYFSGIHDHLKWLLILRVAINMVIFPVLTVLLLKALGFISSVFLKTRKERIIPYITSGIFFFWMYLVFRNQDYIPQVLTDFVFAVFLSSSVAVIANTYFKISMHAIGCGGMLGFLFVIWGVDVSYSISLPLIFALLISGLVCTARLIVSDHTQKEIYLGLLFGFLAQLIAAVL